MERKKRDGDKNEREEKRCRNRDGCMEREIERDGDKEEGRYGERWERKNGDNRGKKARKIQK